MVDPGAIGEALGGSTIAEELKGNFGEAEKNARRLMAAASQPIKRSPGDRLDLALVQILQGSAGAAIEVLDSIAGTELFTLDLRARYASLRHQAVCVRFNTFPGGDGAGAAHLATVRNASAYSVDEQSRWMNTPLE